jgi:ABC-type Mn2+/Zn2+ transport system ATPase subunit
MLVTLVCFLTYSLTHCCRYKLPEQQVADAVETALELVNMKQFMHRATHTLSGGQRQRVAIAGALMPLLQQANGQVLCCSVWFVQRS